jgi:hypothetical protein
VTFDDQSVEPVQSPFACNRITMIVDLSNRTLSQINNRDGVEDAHL